MADKTAAIQAAPSWFHPVVCNNAVRNFAQKLGLALDYKHAAR